MRVFAWLTVASAVTYVDWTHLSQAENDPFYGNFSRWSWGHAGSVWPTLYWLAAAPIGTWLTQRTLRQREAQLGVRMGHAMPLLVAVLSALVLARLFVSLTFPGPELLVVPIALLVVAALYREVRSVISLTCVSVLAGNFLLFNHNMILRQAVVVGEILLVALALGVASVIGRTRRRQRDARASRA